MARMTAKRAAEEKRLQRNADARKRRADKKAESVRRIAAMLPKPIEEYYGVPTWKVELAKWCIESAVSADLEDDANDVLTLALTGVSE